MIEDITDENFVFTKKEECSVVLNDVKEVLNSYITAKKNFVILLKKSRII